MLLPVLAGQQRRLLLAAAANLRSEATRRCLTTAAAGFQLGRVPPPQASSSARRPFPLGLSLGQPVRWSSGGHHGPRKMLIQPSRHQWDHFWDDIHYWALLGIIPCSLLATYLYIFVGPAELTEIPEGYEPQEYEYHRHPLTRFFAWFKTHCAISDQEAYERDAAYLNEDYLRMETRREFRQIKEQEGMLGDYRGYYFIPVNPRPVSQHHAHRQIEDLAGDLPHGFQTEDPRELPTEVDAPTRQF